MQAAAAPGAIVCDEATRSLLDGRVRLRARNEGMHELTSLAGEPPVPPSSPPLSRARASDDTAFRREGEYWTVVYGERVFRLKHSKGAAYLAHLLAGQGETGATLTERTGRHIE